MTECECTLSEMHSISEQPSESMNSHYHYSKGLQVRSVLCMGSSSWINSPTGNGFFQLHIFSLCLQPKEYQSTIFIPSQLTVLFILKSQRHEVSL